MAGLGSVAAVIILSVIRQRRAAKAAERELAAILGGNRR